MLDLDNELQELSQINPEDLSAAMTSQVFEIMVKSSAQLAALYYKELTETYGIDQQAASQITAAFVRSGLGTN